MLTRLFKKNHTRIQAQALYDRLADHARNPWFYSSAGAPDTVDGRFDILVIHVFLAVRRLHAAGPVQAKFAEKLVETFFRRMDDALREMGVGDLSVGKKIRAMAEAYYGRTRAYAEALDAESDADLTAAVSRNVYGADDHAGATMIAAYIARADKALGAHEQDDVGAAFIEASEIFRSLPPEQNRNG